MTKRTTGVLAALFAAALLMTGCAGAAPTAETKSKTTSTATPVEASPRTVYGTVDVAITQAQSDVYFGRSLDDPLRMDESCTSDELGFSDVNVGSQITITDAAGTVVGVGELDDGEFQFEVERGASCAFPFEVSDVPMTGDFYGVQVGNEIRGATQFTVREMQIGPRLYLG